MSLSPRHRIIAGLLAAFYALLAGFGEALHRYGHLADTTAGQTAAACHCGETGCLFELRAKAKRSARELAFRDSSDRSSHDPHECGVCRTLAQLKLASASSAPEAVHFEQARFVSRVGETHYVETERLSLGARGPPVIA